MSYYSQRKLYLPVGMLSAVVLALLSACNGNKLTIESANDSEKSGHVQIEKAKSELTVLQTIELASNKKVHFDGTQPFNIDTNDALFGVVFPATEHQPTIRLKGDGIWDFAQYDDANLALEVYNPESVSVHLYLDLVNDKKVLQSHSVSIPAHYQGRIFFPLTGVEAQTDLGFWGDAPSFNIKNELRMIWRSWKKADISLQNVDEIRLFTIGNLRTKRLGFGELMVRENPPVDPQWLTHLVDKYGQSTRVTNNVTIQSDEELASAANQEVSKLAGVSVPEGRSQYGGWKNGPKLTATGYFRTEKVNGQWWMVDPEGYLFFSHGPANVRMANTTTFTGVDYMDSRIRQINEEELTPEDSLDIVTIDNAIKDTAQVEYPQRNGMFSWLPSYYDPLAKHYSYRRTSHKGPIKHGETYSFYRANLERKYGKDFLLSWEDITIKRMHEWGFTSFGNWVDPMFYDANRIPYFANGWIIGNFKTLSGETNHWGKMPDPYDPEFARRAKITIEQIAKEVNSSPWCAGIFIDNEKSWGEREGSVSARYGVVLDALSKTADESPAKSAFVNVLKQKYTSLSALNTAWNTQFTNWDELDESIQFSDHSEALITDLSLLLEQLGEQYFKVVHNTLETALPNHLYMGARMANWGMPDEIIKASLKYSDALSFNIYEEGMQPHFWAFLEQIDLPVVIGEFHIGSATDSGLYNPGIVHAADQKDRARMYTEYMDSVLSKPYMVGAHWFQYIDEPITGRAHDGENANIGLVTVADIPYPELIDAVKATTHNLYEKRYNQTKQ